MEEKTKNIYQKLNDVRVAWVDLKIKPSGKNKFTSVDYFEEGDLIPNGTKLSKEHGICPVFNLVDDEAELVAYDTESDKTIRFAISRADAGLKGVTPIQNLGAEITYLKRYLWRIYLEAVESDAIDGNNGTGKLDTKSDFTNQEHIEMLIIDTKFTLETIYDWVEKKWGKRIPLNELNGKQFGELKNSLLSAIAKDKQKVDIKEPSPYDYQK